MHILIPGQGITSEGSIFKAKFSEDITFEFDANEVPNPDAKNSEYFL